MQLKDNIDNFKNLLTKLETEIPVYREQESKDLAQTCKSILSSMLDKFETFNENSVITINIMSGEISKIFDKRGEHLNVRELKVLVEYLSRIGREVYLSTNDDTCSAAINVRFQAYNYFQNLKSFTEEYQYFWHKLPMEVWHKKTAEYSLKIQSNKDQSIEDIPIPTHF